MTSKRKSKSTHDWYEVDLDRIPLHFKFSVPDPTVEDKLRNLIASFPVAGYDTRRNVARGYAPLKGRSPDIVGDLRSILERLMEVLRSDYSLTQLECHEWGGGVEYLVYDSGLTPGGVEIATRLFNLEQPGVGILYGRHVRRITDDTYALWSDD